MPAMGMLREADAETGDAVAMGHLLCSGAVRRSFQTRDAGRLDSAAHSKNAGIRLPPVHRFWLAAGHARRGAMAFAPLTPEEARALQSAAQSLNAGRARDAASQVKPLIVAGSRDPDLLMLYSAACERLGNASEALGACNAAVQSAPERADAWAGLGRLLHEQGQSVQGAEVLERAVELDPGKAEYWYNLGLASEGAGKRERALEALATATRLSPQWAMPWAMRGQVHLSQDA